MSWKPRNYKKNLELLKKRSHELHRKMEDGSFYDLSYFARYREVRKIKQLYNRLMGPLSEGALKQAVSFASVLMLITGAGCDSSSDDGTASVTLQLQIGKASGTAALSQASLTKSSAPSTVTGITVTVTGKNMAPIVKEISTESSSTGLVVPAGPNRRFYVQADTIYEGFICGTVVRDIPPNKSIVLPIRMEGCGMPELQLNTTDNPLSSISTSPAYLSFGDLDGDGDQDLMLSYNVNIEYYENTGSGFVLSSDPTGLGNNDRYRNFVDIDSDGDLDVFTAGYYSGDQHIFAYTNQGSITSPNFSTHVLVPNTLGTNYKIFSFGDIDNDGDYDIISGRPGGLPSDSDTVKFFENIGTVTSYSFATEVSDPFSFGNISFVDNLAPIFIDIDNDGDLDIFIGMAVYGAGPEGYTVLYTNTGSPNTPSFDDGPIPDPFNIQTEITSLSLVYPAFADLDQDGDLDLFIGSSSGSILYFENIIIP